MKRTPRARTRASLAREALRLEASLKAAEGKPIYCFLHYPPIYQGYKCPEMLELLDKYEVERCYYGHLHGYTHRRAFEGMREKTEYALIAADYGRLSACKNLQLRHKLMQKGWKF